MARQRGDEGIRPQELPKGLRPETLGELERDEKRLERAFDRMDREEQQRNREIRGGGKGV